MYLCKQKFIQSLMIHFKISPMNTMNKDFLEKREIAIKKIMAAKERKAKRIAEITKSLCEEFKERTGSYPKNINFI